MKKKFIVKTNLEFNNIIKVGKRIKSNYFYIYFLNNNLGYNRYGITVSKKIGNAVFRNKYKRKIRIAIDNNTFNINKCSIDCIIIARSGIKNLNTLDIVNEISILKHKIGEINEKNN